jgi:hypothetical protein
MMTEKVPTDATRPTTKQAITARVCPGLRSNCRATYFRSMATVPGSRVAAANPRRSMYFWKDARLSTIQYARGHEKLRPRLWRRWAAAQQPLESPDHRRGRAEAMTSFQSPQALPHFPPP